MAIQCTHCGKALKEDTRFCNNCGTLVPTHLLSPKTTATTPPVAQTTGDTEHASRAREIMREQIAQQPPYRAHPVRRQAQDEPPSWISQLDSGVRSNRSTLPTDGLSDTPQLDFPVPEAAHRPNSPIRELRVKVWEQEVPAVPVLQETAVEVEEDDFEDLPTGPLVASAPDKHVPPNATHSPARTAQDAHIDDVERLDTVRLSTQMGVKPASSSRPVGASSEQSWPPQQSANAAPATYQHTPPRTPQAPFNPYASSSASFYSRETSQPVYEENTGVSSAPAAQDWKQTPPPQKVVPPPKRRKSRKALLFVLVVLVVLVIGGSVGAWVILAQPFSIPGVTQPQQSFSSTRLGLSLLYPSGWKSQLDQGKATVHFNDSSNTDQVNIVVASSSGGDLEQYLQREANQLGMIGLKTGTPVSFAGASWKQLEGSVLQRGASYIETLFVTTHNRNNVTMMFLAPQTTYAQEEQLVFSTMRSSFQFLQ